MSQEPGNDDNAPGTGQDEGFSQPARILVVEDDIDTLHLFGRLLRLAPLEMELPYASIAPIEEHDGEEAIAFLHTLEGQSIDGILLDMQLGAVSGFDVLRDMEMDERLRQIPVCMITGGELHDEPLVTPYLALTCQDGLTTRELTQAIAALMPIVLPGLNVRAQDARAKDLRVLQPSATPQSIEPR